MRLFLQQQFSIFSEILKYTIMKKFKEIDFYISTGLITTFTILTLVEGGGFFSENLILGLIVVGTWQSISMLTHAIRQSFTQNHLRSAYHIISLFTLITLPLGSFWILPAIAPIMAVFYTWLCYDETFNRMRRPLSYIK